MEKELKKTKINFLKILLSLILLTFVVIYIFYINNNNLKINAKKTNQKLNVPTSINKSSSNIVYIPDANLKNELLKNFKAANFSADFNLYYDYKKNSYETEIYRDELRLVMQLGIHNKNIKDLTGIEYCENAINFAFLNNQITSIYPIRNLTNLTYLVLRDNRISDVSYLSRLTNLTDLLIESNRISTGVNAIGNLVNLTRLGINDNPELSDISSFKNLSKLKLLNMHTCNVKDITALKYLTNLEDLSVMKNKVEDISPVSNLPKLKILSASFNNIEDISSLSNIKTLDEIYLHNNKIRDFRPIKNLKLNRGGYVGSQKIDFYPKNRTFELGLFDASGKKYKLESEYLKQNENGTYTVIKKPANNLLELKISPNWGVSEYSNQPEVGEGSVRIHTNNINIYNPQTKKLIVRKNDKIDIKKGITNLEGNETLSIINDIDTSTIGQKTGKIKVIKEKEEYIVDINVEVIDNIEIAINYIDKKDSQKKYNDINAYLLDEKKDKTYKMNYDKNKYTNKIKEHSEYKIVYGEEKPYKETPDGFKKQEVYKIIYKGDPNTKEELIITKDTKEIERILLYENGVKRNNPNDINILIDKLILLPYTGSNNLFKFSATSFIIFSLTYPLFRKKVNIFLKKYKLMK